MEEVSKTPNKGKRKIPIEPITNKTRKQVTFSKRRGGLFKKGSELCSLCGANVAIITFSGAGKLFGFGHPSAESVVQRYINSTKNNKIKFNQHFGNNNDGNDNDNSNYNYDYGKFSKQYKDIIGQIEAEKRAISSTNTNNNVNNDNGNLFWWDNVNIDELKLVELEQFKVALEGLRNDVICRVDEINQSSMCYVPQNFRFSTRDGNIAAHCQGFDEFTTDWADHEMGKENLHQVPLSADSVLDLGMKAQKPDIF
ncbi:agamous-like MADS-box protein AGL62 [Silene latifolia]|uniref:agamous-like MADS-box protein AGL62 n=1 Tax=Silene latifolia TaxID=37657 RepID=UPI003D77A6F6